jgi:hypothetical protein
LHSHGGRADSVHVAIQHQAFATTFAFEGRHDIEPALAYFLFTDFEKTRFPKPFSDKRGNLFLAFAIFDGRINAGNSDQALQ